VRSREILGVRVDFGLSKGDFLSRINTLIESPGSHKVFTINPEFIMKSRKEEGLSSVLNESDLSVPDGAGILFANKYLEGVSKMKRGFLYPLRAFVYGTFLGLGSFLRNDLFGDSSRLTGADLIYDICEQAAEKGQTVFLLGGWEKDKRGRMKKHHGNISDKAAEALKELHPNLRIIGSSSDFHHREADDAETVSYIRNCMKNEGVEHIDVLFVGYTSGEQEKWIARNLEKIPVKVGIGVGATFDFVTKNYDRASEALKRMNLEWLHRLITQPWRLKRIIMSFPAFPLLVYFDSLKD